MFGLKGNNNLGFIFSNTELVLHEVLQVPETKRISEFTEINQFLDSAKIVELDIVY